MAGMQGMAQPQGKARTKQIGIRFVETGYYSEQGWMMERRAAVVQEDLGGGSFDEPKAARQLQHTALRAGASGTGRYWSARITSCGGSGSLSDPVVSGHRGNSARDTLISARRASSRRVSRGVQQLNVSRSSASMPLGNPMDGWPMDQAACTQSTCTVEVLGACKSTWQGPVNAPIGYSVCPEQRDDVLVYPSYSIDDSALGMPQPPHQTRLVQASDRLRRVIPHHPPCQNDVPAEKG
ncbi:hypothetical protein M441DRAFT_42221 [Trichoderma asperellum CBS 433.97]|uniref:Uncharacterized protein n=1 Tax=Trichoderma asperellum (strain ATCC 204424 / CBS 433.97 / NBRC 101777) TaxID=1042311 RepID=A0A2T3ZNQ7_TRIA4|nr:hypothetical protein M441DRAFT_42221 [Trichoderma asperellum CBS 433.97]PTB46421.1 hypothetical protein M441DRAFT_42221 [Trichoderma asperellum CBS 433.97]